MILSGKSDNPFLIIHGGAGPMDPTAKGMAEATEALLKICLETHKKGFDQSSEQIISNAVAGMEDNPLFNAGYGSALQQDGEARVSASLMTGEQQKFSAVVGLCRTRHPSQIALKLQDEDARVVASPGNEFLARECGLPVESLVTTKRLQQWVSKSDAAQPKACDTVGAVFWKKGQSLAAATSTGGKGYEYPGRMSDAVTVAGNYASRFAAVAATGIGEEIVDDALCARLETRVRDGMSLAEASQKCYEEAKELQRSYGWIANDAAGHWSIAFTTAAMSFVVMDVNQEILASSAPD